MGFPRGARPCQTAEVHPDSPKPLISARDLEVTYGDNRALAMVNLEVRPRTVAALLGPNGAGKTTFVRCVTTLAKPTGGTLEVLGFDVGKDRDEVRSRIGLSGQTTALDDRLTGRETLTMYGRLLRLSSDEIERRIVQLTEICGLEDFIDQRAHTYSGGMKRRLDLGASLIGDPELLVLDEPTTGLDPASRHRLWAMIESLPERGTGVLLTTQYLEEADQLADQVVIIDKGRVIANDTPSSIKAAVGDSVLEIVYETEIQAQQVATAIRATTRVEGSTVYVPAPDPGTAMTVLTEAQQVGPGPESFGLRRPTLDDAFIALTSP